MKIAFDIGGVLSKYPGEFRVLIAALAQSPLVDVRAITDQTDRDYTLQRLKDNGFDIPPDRVHNADYAQCGGMCKAVVVNAHGIDVIIDR